MYVSYPDVQLTQFFNKVFVDYIRFKLDIMTSEVTRQLGTEEILLII